MDKLLHKHIETKVFTPPHSPSIYFSCTFDISYTNVFYSRDLPPSADEICRWFLTLPDTLQGRSIDPDNPSQTPKVALSTLREIESILSNLLASHYEAHNFKFTRVMKSRIDSLFGKLLLEKVIVNATGKRIGGPALRMVHIRQMAEAKFQDAITNGTYSGDRTILDVLAIVTQAMACSRGGDVNVADKQEAVKTLLFIRDIDLRLSGKGDDFACVEVDHFAMDQTS